ncbi:SH3 domain-containing protein [Celeribacter indicus]|uniref:SH3 type 3 domain-containing protein n=1 Tax=Celeribacter indicus TaxID=1208324 RepID=A0A0B5DQE9_9RHOB|nr:SH3 domain-containing protein [Celeribacter indicus]AJE45344.1 SH3 type 3 domain-containing protein [Celeribacter indicus]SDW99463.1 SH3 domain-containing protein [Celeribacter indicus]
MLRLTALTLAGLYAAFTICGSDLSPEEQAAWDARKTGRTSVVATLGDTLKTAFAGQSLRQGDYVPTLAEMRVQKEPAPDRVNDAPAPDGLVQMASYDGARPAVAQTAAGPVPVTPATATTHVSDPEKLAALVKPDAADRKKAAEDLREVTASRVNVRSGPSTANPVLDQVVRTDIVQVVEDTGTGWVKIRIEGDGIEGYMAARFLTDYGE